MTQERSQEAEVGNCHTDSQHRDAPLPTSTTSTRSQPAAQPQEPPRHLAAASPPVAAVQHPQANCQPSESSAHQRPASDSSNQSTEQNFATPTDWPSRQQPPGSNPPTHTSDTDGSQFLGSDEGGEGPGRGREKRSREQFDEGESEGEDQFDDCNLSEPAGKISKKQRLHWSSELHTRFMNAVHHLGIEAAVPKRILQLMNVEGMTRDNVASHLQKYRLHLKKLAGVGANDPIPGHMITQVQNNAMRLHKAKQQQEAHQMSLIKKSRSAEAEALIGQSSAAQSSQVTHAALFASPYPAAAAAAAAAAAPQESGVLRPQPTRTAFIPPLSREGSMGADKGHQGQADMGEGAWATAYVPVTAPSAMMPASTSMDALQLGYTLGLMQSGAGSGWKPPASHHMGPAIIAPPALMPNPVISPTTSILHMPPQLQGTMYDPTAAAAAVMMASSLHPQSHHQHQHQQHQAALAAMALQQMYCLPTYPQQYVVSNGPPGAMRPQGDMAMYGLQASGNGGALWPAQPNPFFPHGLLPPPPR